MAVPKKTDLWYVRLTINQPDGTYVPDKKINQLWTNRDDLLALYQRRLGKIERLTPIELEHEPLDQVLYRYWDDEEEHAWRYFYVGRYYLTDGEE
jgi:hypothetical protein